MKNLAIAIVLVATLSLQAGAQGIEFMHAASFKEVLQKAKAENKYIFIDAYTTWCGPCKMMAKNIFPQPEVGEYFNKNFINLKVQLDTTAKDDDFVKSWYADASAIGKKYKVKVYPTYLFVSPDGELVHRAVGSSDAPKFIAKAANALNENTQYYTLMKKYKAGNTSDELMLNLALAAEEAYEMDQAAAVSKVYISRQADLLTPTNIRALEKFTRLPSDTGFKLMLKNPMTFNAVLGEGKAESITRIILLREEFFPLIHAGDKPDFVKFKKHIDTKYGERNDVVDYAEMFYYQRTGEWEKFADAATRFMNANAAVLSPVEINSVAWAVFEHCEDMKCVEQAVAWSKLAAEKGKDAAYYDTYANLLYKSGQKAEAIAAQEKAIAIAKSEPGSDTKELEGTLDKMKRGEKTWK